MAEDAFEYRLQVLRDEIGIIQSRIGGFDSLSFQVKGWAATLWAASVSFGIRDVSLVGVALSIPLLLTFWTLDAFFKSYQHRVRARMGVIERFLNSPDGKATQLDRCFTTRSFGDFPVHDPMCWQTLAMADPEFRTAFQRKTGLRRSFWTGNVCLMYSTMMLASILVMLYLAVSGRPTTG